MGLDIHFSEDVSRILTALDESNQMATDLALAAGADARDTQLARYVYQSALAHVGRAFGLQPTELVVILTRREVIANVQHRPTGRTNRVVECLAG